MVKIVYAVGITIGSYIGGWIATLLGAGYFSGWGIIASGIGGFVGIYLAYKFNANYIDS